MREFTLNAEQTEALDKLSSFSESKNFFVLKGYAGTGKSTVIAEWVKRMTTRPDNLPEGKIWRRPNICLTAPTNKASNVLSDKASEIKLAVECSTIHSLLNLRMVWQKDKQVLVPSRSDDGTGFEDYDYVVIDECSMINEELLQYILDAQEFAGNKVIFMGDPCQLPPVKEKESASFTIVKEPMELTQVMRQADGSNILPLSLYLRDLIIAGGKAYPSKIFTFVDGKTVDYKPAKDNLDDILDWMEATHYDDAWDTRHIAWTNRVVDSWNDMIRDRIYGSDRDEWMADENIVTTSPVLDPVESRVVYSTDTMLTIRGNISESSLDGVPVWKIPVKSEQGKRFILRVVQKRGQKTYADKKAALLQEAKSNKAWRPFYAFCESFNSIKPAHSMTAHRSQGSTFDEVYVSLDNILQNPRRKESLQCLYVAATRPRTRLVFV